MELASAPLAKWQLIFSAHISCIYKGKIWNASCGCCSSVKGKGDFLVLVMPRVHMARHVWLLAQPKPGTAKAWHCHVPAPQGQGHLCCDQQGFAPPVAPRDLRQPERRRAQLHVFTASLWPPLCQQWQCSLPCWCWCDKNNLTESRNHPQQDAQFKPSLTHQPLSLCRVLQLTPEWWEGKKF